MTGSNGSTNGSGNKDFPVSGTFRDYVKLRRDDADLWGNEPPWPEMAAEAFHGIAGDVVDAIAPHTEADRVALLLHYLVMAGNVMDPSSILLIMAPILFPLATNIGVQPIHLGILMAVNMEVGLCHPPVGLNLYVGSGIAKMGISEITIAVLPWLCGMVLFLLMVTYIPQISLWLPRLLGIL